MVDHTQPEMWRAIPGINEEFQVSTWHRVRRWDGERWVGASFADFGRARVKVGNRWTSRVIARMVADAFPETLPPEKWKRIIGFGGRYEVSNRGNVREGERLLKRSGAWVRLEVEDGRHVPHRVRELVREAFGPLVEEDLLL